MNAHFVGASVAVLAVIILWRGYRGYKHMSRRCPGCGRPDVERKHFIFLPPSEVSHKFSLFSPNSGKFRWFIRPVKTCTIAHCPNVEEPHRRIWVVKISSDPISLWHAWWTDWFHPEQYERPIGQDMIAVWDYAKEFERFKSGELDSHSTDTPVIFTGFLKVVMDYAKRILRKYKKK